MATIKIQQFRSAIKSPKRQKLTIQALGFRKLKVQHLVKVVE